MRIKFDFVTNSSSVSFVGWGLIFDKFDFLEENEEVVKKSFESIKLSRWYDGISFEAYKEEDMYKILSNLPTKRVTFECHYDTYYVGGLLRDIRDHETPAEFKKEVLSELISLGFKVDNLVFIDEAWRDG